ncbi:hypothetical protein B0H14DRAFT_2637551 [Mycena olivaceomarginata]|nr:hypothetical protein B0H14DRAFT_2637551 [Mycena olivaceomarginata]
MAAPKHMQTLGSGSRQHQSWHFAAAVGVFSAALGPVCGTYKRQHSGNVVLQRQFNNTSAAVFLWSAALVLNMRHYVATLWLAQTPWQYSLAVTRRIYRTRPTLCMPVYGQRDFAAAVLLPHAAAAAAALQQQSAAVEPAGHVQLLYTTRHSAAALQHQNTSKHCAAAVGSALQPQSDYFSGSLPYAAAVWRHLEGVTARQCDIAAAVWRQLNLTSAAILRHLCTQPISVVMDEGQVGQGRGEGRVRALRAGTGATTSNVTALGTTAALLTPASSELLASATTVPEGGWDDAGGHRVSARERVQAD